MTDLNNAQTEATTTTTETVEPAPKVKRIRRPSQTAKPVEAPKGKTAKPAKATEAPKADAPKAAPKPKVEKPTRAVYAFDTGYVGSSTALNDKASKTLVDHSRFGTGTDWNMTERDQRSVEALRKEFGAKPFKRENIDAGILRRLGERGCIAYIGGTHADSEYKLTNKGLGKPEPRAKKAA